MLKKNLYLKLFFFAKLFLFPELKVPPIPQKTKGIIINPINIPANFVFANFLILLSILYF